MEASTGDGKQYTRRMCIVINDPQSDVLSNKALIGIHQNTLQTEPLLLRMGIRKHICNNDCCRNMCQAYVGQLPNGTVRTGACNRRTACRIQHKSFAVYFEYAAVYFQVYGRILGGIRPYTSSIRCSLVAPRTKAIGQ